ncbi:MAG TPA: sigma-54-dependent Fis family transcriptional regulator [Planctomycetaceae bacterium]|nr:sigma-54-dependent Fis family transcriptional regulator [Planctomycetaceae bacterium]
MNALCEKSQVNEYLKSMLLELNAEFSALSAFWWERRPAWTLICHTGRQTASEIDLALREDVLDREDAVVFSHEDLRWLMFPVDDSGLIVLGGKSFDEERATSAWRMGQMLAASLTLFRRIQHDHRFTDRLRETLDVSVRFSVAENTEQLLTMIAEEATRVLACDRASIFLWDREQHEVVAVPALGVEGGSLRIPDNRGIVGEVLSTQETLIVNDAYADPRFNQNVDKLSGYKTETLLCCPLRDGADTMIGAFEVINKNEGHFDADDAQILSLLGIQAANALQTTKQREDLIRSHRHLAEKITEDSKIIGSSPSMQSLKDTIARLAQTDLPVLILGESGTGKEVTSQALHYQGTRKDKPFIAVNCAALAESLLESELFGHEKGAFTDAHEARAGKFELADGGTLFLDEIGDMSPGGQAKLLRVLEEKVVTRVGGSNPISVSVRVIAATNSDLAAKVSEKRFREDLYYRLSVVTIELLPLRERPEDILLLAEHFLTQFCREANRPTLILGIDARRRLQSHAWPGNVRELRNLMERVAFLATGNKVEADDLAFILSPNRPAVGLEPSYGLSLDDATKQFQREFIRRALRRLKGNLSEASRLLGLHRSNLYRKMKHLDMDEVDGVN